MKLIWWVHITDAFLNLLIVILLRLLVGQAQHSFNAFYSSETGKIIYYLYVLLIWCLFQLMYAPRICTRISGPAVYSRFSDGCFHACTEDANTRFYTSFALYLLIIVIQKQPHSLEEDGLGRRQESRQLAALSPAVLRPLIHWWRTFSPRRHPTSTTIAAWPGPPPPTAVDAGSNSLGCAADRQRQWQRRSGEGRPRNARHETNWRVSFLPQLYFTSSWL